MDFVPLITALQSQHTTSVSISTAHIALVCLWGCHGRQRQSLVKAWKENVCGSHPVHWDFLIEGYLVGQEWFLFCKSALTTPNYLVLPMSENGFQDYLLLHLPRYQREAGLHLVLCIVILKDWGDIFFLPIIRSISYCDCPGVIQSGLTRIRQPVADTCDDHGPASAQESVFSCLFPMPMQQCRSPAETHSVLLIFQRR